MNGRDLRASVFIAMLWLLGLAMYSTLKIPVHDEQDLRVDNVAGQPPVPMQAIYSDRAPKHSRLLTRWAHQRWGAA